MGATFRSIIIPYPSLHLQVSMPLLKVIPSISSNEVAANVKLENRYQFTVADGTMSISATQTTPSFYANVPSTKKYFKKITFLLKEFS